MFFFGDDIVVCPTFGVVEKLVSWRLLHFCLLLWVDWAAGVSRWIPKLNCHRMELEFKDQMSCTERVARDRYAVTVLLLLGFSSRPLVIDAALVVNRTVDSSITKIQRCLQKKL